MLKLSERTDKRTLTMELLDLDDDGTVSMRHTESFSLYGITENTPAVTYMLYDSDMGPISSVYRFLNEYHAHSSESTRKKYAYALRFFHCYCAVMSFNPFAMTYAQFLELRDYMQGIGKLASAESPQRGGESVNQFIGALRGYFTFMAVDCPYLFDTRMVTMTTENKDEGYSADMRNVSYTSNLKTAPEKSQVPKHLKPDEFLRLLKVIRSHGDRQAENIVDLEYLGSLRIGEALGLTLEDFVVEKDYVKVLIRNRTSDKDYQHAKYRMTVKESKEYRLKRYAEDTKTAIIRKELYQKIVEYAEEQFEALSEKIGEDELRKRAYADTVSPSTFEGESNMYLFLGSTGKPLSDQAWNIRLREYFLEADLEVDFGKKKDGLNHRLRHGFAMLHAYYRKDKANALELMKLLRVRNISTVLIYFSVTDDERAEIINGFSDELKAMLPGLYEWEDETGV